ncbi:DNA repair protein RecO [Wolbachia endosymbiont of Chironomus riparius]|uniref:DNA repair protein RecO n=1 Tax=Wolbachia endosymbiont of Chironomus riparius TaxID=2883238 RepID=UPI0020A01007|nr:DNA repair protein RecO [Wolbachia endosymbiont of Chironomus riparius]
MKWRDEGIVIATKEYGDKNLILSLFTKNHGKWKGLVRARNGKLQISNLLHVEWSAKLLENLGFFKCELIESPFHYFYHDRMKNVAVVSFSSILEKVLPEGEPFTVLYNNFQCFIDLIKDNSKFWYSHYLNLELSLLTQLGFQLDLSKCAVTGSTEDLQFISPKTGRAVSRKIGGIYVQKLLPFPRMLYDVYNHNVKDNYSIQEFQNGLEVVGYFLNKYLFLQLNKKFPESRKLMFSF